MPETEQQAIQRFAEKMLAKMEERRKRYKPFGWRDPEYKSVLDLISHLRQEILEWDNAETIEEKMAELVDVANTAFMLHDRYRLHIEKK